MSTTSTGSNNVELCENWYKAFDRRDLDAVMTFFTDDVVVEIDFGRPDDQALHAVAYAGKYVGKEEVREFYEMRFSKVNDDAAPIRPLCAFVPQPCQFGSWVIFSGTIRDHRRTGEGLYDGPFLHVWTIAPGGKKISSLCMHLDRAARIVPGRQGA